MRVLAAPQALKEVRSAPSVARSIAHGVRDARPAAEVDEMPLADGGEGTARALSAAAGGRVRRAITVDALGRPCSAVWAQLPDGSAVVELAEAAGIGRIAQPDRDPARATTYGVGLLLRATLAERPRRIIVGLGGSATNDGGAGLLRALGCRFLDASGYEVADRADQLVNVCRVDIQALTPALLATPLVVATDVDSPLLGPIGATSVFGPQKGVATALQPVLELGLRRLADALTVAFGRDTRDLPGAGAAGGAGAALLSFPLATRRSGAEVVLEAAGSHERIARSDLVITAEGRLDATSVRGKCVGEVARIASSADVPCVALAAVLDPGWDHAGSGIAAVELLRPTARSLAAARRHATGDVRAAAARAICALNVTG